MQSIRNTWAIVLIMAGLHAVHQTCHQSKSLKGTAACLMAGSGAPDLSLQAIVSAPLILLAASLAHKLNTILHAVITTLSKR